jgi:hypothetical protein
VCHVDENRRHAIAWTAATSSMPDVELLEREA